MERAWKYGDALFETIRVYNGKLLWLDYHIKRLEKGMHILGFQASFELEASFFYKCLPSQAENGRLRLTFIRKDGGLYAPINNDISCLVDYKPLTGSLYALNEKGLVLKSGFDLKLPIWSLSGIKTCNALPYVLAAQYAQRQKVDDTLILNANNLVAEASSSNIFIFKNNTFFTTTDNCGAINGVMQAATIDFFSKNNIPIVRKPLSMDEIYRAEGVFLSNSIRGWRWVGEIDDISYEKDVINKFLIVFLDSIQSQHTN